MSLYLWLTKKGFRKHRAAPLLTAIAVIIICINLFIVIHSDIAERGRLVEQREVLRNHLSDESKILSFTTEPVTSANLQRCGSLESLQRATDELSRRDGNMTILSFSGPARSSSISAQKTDSLEFSGQGDYSHLMEMIDLLTADDSCLAIDSVELHRERTNSSQVSWTLKLSRYRMVERSK